MSNKETLAWCAYNLELAKDEFEKAGEISNYAEGVLKTADFYKSTITEQEKVISELVSAFRLLHLDIVNKDASSVLDGDAFIASRSLLTKFDSTKHKQLKGE